MPSNLPSLSLYEQQCKYFEEKKWNFPNRQGPILQEELINKKKKSSIPRFLNKTKHKGRKVPQLVWSIRPILQLLIHRTNRSQTEIWDVSDSQHESTIHCSQQENTVTNFSLLCSTSFTSLVLGSFDLLSQEVRAKLRNKALSWLLNTS